MNASGGATDPDFMSQGDGACFQDSPAAGVFAAFGATVGTILVIDQAGIVHDRLQTPVTSSPLDAVVRALLS